MDLKWKVKEIVIIALVAAVVGVIYTVMDFAYAPLSALLGPIFMELTFGVYLLSALLPMYIGRKPGFAIFGALVCAGVNLLLGSPYGIQVVLAGTLQAIGTEIAFLIGKKYSGSWTQLIITGILAPLCVFCRDYIVFGYSTMDSSILIAMLAVRIASAIIIGSLLTKGITAGLKKAGVLKGFRCM